MKTGILLLLLAAAAPAADPQARNIILFLGDAAGLPTIHAASLYAGKPRQFFIHKMPHIALMDTSAAQQWVTDSAAGMTAIVTGRKTQNGVLSQSDTAVRGVKDGAPLKTILEYAEEHGLSTGAVSNSDMDSATPAACYAHVNDRRKRGEIFAEALSPRFGDGVDVIIGPGRAMILEATAKLGLDLVQALPAKNLPLYDSLNAVPRVARRAVVLFPNDAFDLAAATGKAIEILSRNAKGYFLMVESDTHTDDLVRGLKHMAELDQIIRQTAQRTKSDETLILFTADHSFGTRLRSGRRDEPLLPPTGDVKLGKNVLVDGGHTGEPVVVAAQGPGAQHVRGFIDNTDIFRIMMAAYGWKE